MRKMYNGRIGDPSSKYGYGDGNLDEDVQNKLDIAKELEDEIWQSLMKVRRYNDNIPMSYNYKIEILTRVYKRFYDKYI